MTILITTDFSNNSKSAIRFAIQLAKQTPTKLILYHTLELLVPTSWSQGDANHYVKTEFEKCEENLREFARSIFKKADAKDVPYECVVEVGTDVDSKIIDYAKKMSADYICMSTRGAGVIKKFMGTNASILVSTSPIPVMVIPQNYRIKPITQIGYASDFENIEKELSTVSAFAHHFKAPIEIYHLYYQVQETETEKTRKSIVHKYQSAEINFHIKPLFVNYAHSLAEGLQQVVKKAKPSVLIMFSKQKKNWLERFFFESKTSDMTYDIKVPIIAFRK